MSTTLTNDGKSIILTIHKDKLTPEFMKKLEPHIETKISTTQEKSNREDQIMYMFSMFGLDLEKDQDDFSKVINYLT